MALTCQCNMVTLVCILQISHINKTRYELTYIRLGLWQGDDIFDSDNIPDSTVKPKHLHLPHKLLHILVINPLCNLKIFLPLSIKLHSYKTSDRELSRIDNSHRKLIKPGIHTNRILLAYSLKHKLLLKRYCILYMLHPISGDTALNGITFKVLLSRIQHFKLNASTEPDILAGRFYLVNLYLSVLTYHL